MKERVKAVLDADVAKMDLAVGLGGYGKKDAIQGRIALIQKELEKSTSDYDKEKLSERIAKLSGESIRLPRPWWGRVTVLSLLNISAWSVLIVFGVQQMPAGRSAIIAYTLPIWSVLFSLWLLHEPLSGRKIGGLVLGVAGMAVLLGEEALNVRRAPIGFVASTR